jgi:peptide/nickel transport system substrate-binding protein
VTAQDVVFTFSSVLDPKVNSTIASNYDALEQVSAPDERTVVFRLKYPYAPFAQRLLLGIVPRKAFDGRDINTAPFNTAPIGTGPYMVSEWRKGDRLVLTANEKYWGGAPAVKTATVVFVTDDNARATRMAAGEFDATVLPPKLAKTYAGRDDYRVVEVNSADYRGLGIPSALPFTSDTRVRLAINLGINRQAMIDTVLAGAGKPAATPISPYLSQWYQPSATFRYDPVAAGRLLDEAGWTAGPDGKRSRGGEPARLPILYPAEDSLRKELALASASDLAKLGIDAPVEGTTFEIMLKRQETAAIWGGGDPYDPDSAAYTLLHSRYIGQPGYVNMTLYRNPAVDAALDTDRFVRQSLLEALTEDYVLGARSRGLPERTVVLNHALRTALLPFLTLLGARIPELITGALLVETVFSWPGIAKATVDAALNVDFSLLAALTLLATGAVLAGNLLADVLYALADPRVGLDG